MHGWEIHSQKMYQDFFPNIKNISIFHPILNLRRTTEQGIYSSELKSEKRKGHYRHTRREISSHIISLPFQFNDDSQSKTLKPG